MDWVDRPQNCKGLYGILQLLQGSHLDNFPLKTLKLDWVAFLSVTFQLKCLDIQSNQCKKLVPVLSRFCNGLCGEIESRVSGAVIFLITSCSSLIVTGWNESSAELYGSPYRPTKSFHCFAYIKSNVA